jgi:hypothetical protein
VATHVARQLRSYIWRNDFIETSDRGNAGISIKAESPFTEVQEHPERLAT